MNPPILLPTEQGWSEGLEGSREQGAGRRAGLESEATSWPELTVVRGVR